MDTLSHNRVSIPNKMLNLERLVTLQHVQANGFDASNANGLTKTKTHAHAAHHVVKVDVLFQGQKVISNPFGLLHV